MCVLLLVGEVRDRRRCGTANMSLFFFNDTATTEIYTLSLHDALPISSGKTLATDGATASQQEVESTPEIMRRSEEHTSELQSPDHLVCRLLLEKKKIQQSEPDCLSAHTMNTTTRVQRLRHPPPEHGAA